MSEAGKSCEPQPATVLVDIPNKHLHVLNEIIKLVDPEMQPIIECINKVNGDTRRVRYASWMKRQLIPGFLKGKTWKDLIKRIMNIYGDEKHLVLFVDVCWAIVVAELIRALRQIDGRDADVNIRYSAQELIDFVDPVQRRVERKHAHYCYPLNLSKDVLGMLLITLHRLSSDISKTL
ncbi:PREDICTED: uncharacterized protein LOC106339153 [Brassica oleracea var. oleracea]|uniref:uncharacterized protein LOC106339153 n=1 Tax=Brassica oleracea var. oleracea TaxID=109376 RepID=UPI0006A6E448|nr:PREDICTED: uncharacterized protein LOC106339153 [Brassica oleracea var. oleracea]